MEGDNVDSSCDNQDSLAPNVGLVTITFTSIQAALDSAAEGDILWAGPGTYLEFGLSMNGKGLTLASTPGAETTVIDAQSQGSAMVFDHGPDETSKVRLQRAGAAQTVVDGRQDGSVVIADSATLELKGLTLMNGNASSGGGLEARQNLGMLSNVTFSANSASHGGGLSLSSSYPTFNQVSLIGNSAGDGGGM